MRFLTGFLGPVLVGRLVRALGRASDRRAVPGTVGLSYAALSRLPRLADRLGVEPEALPYLSHPTRTRGERSREPASGVRCSRRTSTRWSRTSASIRASTTRRWCDTTAIVECAHGP
ncbi:hypothetical protein NDI85_10195 [Halomicroarcula sp. S1AR25-4]|uniref:hypothetical protein n=1 Tax=Haloarcula sp. S1AR25-4 TaxID=2950538 RepID=UPI002873F4FB|nr:hypothetical protein [Halomicroarcula sp. S1AR25-4]MDS0278165.1 hypothetical protein [Halomicroarcula sp. S1AR25-4]